MFRFWWVFLAFLCAVLILWAGAPLWLFCVAVVCVLGMLAVEHITKEGGPPCNPGGNGSAT